MTNTAINDDASASLVYIAWLYSMSVAQSFSASRRSDNDEHGTKKQKIFTRMGYFWRLQHGCMDDKLSKGLHGEKLDTAQRIYKHGSA
jgi:hypothetical protein